MLLEPQISSDGASQDASSKISSSSALIKERIRRTLAKGLYYSRTLAAVRRLAQNYHVEAHYSSKVPHLRRDSSSKFAILCYHRVGTEGIPFFSRLDPSVFEAQMRYLKKHYRVVSLGQLCKELRDSTPVEPTLAITFDDGYRDLYSYALPVLRKYQIPATVYLIGRCMETGEAPWYDRIFAALQTALGSFLDLQLAAPRHFTFTSKESRVAAAWEIVRYLRTIPDAERREWCANFERRLTVPQPQIANRILNWEQVQEMRREGVDFGAHTMTHPAVGRLNSQAFDEELLQSKRLLENGLNAPVEDFAYPFGKLSDCSPAAEEFLSRCAYRSAVTTVEGYNVSGANRFQLFRLQVNDDPSLPSFALAVGRLFLEAPPEWLATQRVSTDLSTASSQRETI
jgi:peptidoglycan/xylan/chitin deacetylase (PgdA/CDA1 family)